MKQSTLRKVHGKIRQLDATSREHSIRVAELMKLVARSRGLDCEKAYLIGMLHDVGKMYIPSNILKKPIRLTAVEREAVDMHSLYGYMLVRDWGFDDDIAIPILYHHGIKVFNEKYKKPTDEQMKYTKMLHTIDCYDAMIQNRPYHKAFTKNETLQIINTDRNICRETYKYIEQHL